MMRSPEDICCISLPIRSALAFMARRIMAVVWAAVMRIILQLPSSIGQTDSERSQQVGVGMHGGTHYGGILGIVNVHYPATPLFNWPDGLRTLPSGPQTADWQ